MLVSMTANGVLIPNGAYVTIEDEKNNTEYFRITKQYLITFKNISCKMSERYIDIVDERKYKLRKFAVTIRNCIFETVSSSSKAIQANKRFNVIGHINKQNKKFVLLEEDNELLIAPFSSVYYPDEIEYNKNILKNKEHLKWA